MQHSLYKKIIKLSILINQKINKIYLIKLDPFYLN